MDNAAAWCVLLASREINHLDVFIPTSASAQTGVQAMVARQPMTETLRRAAAISAPGQIAVIISGASNQVRTRNLDDVEVRNIFLQPQYKGTGYEVLLSLLALEDRVTPATPILFLPIDHVVSDAEVMTRSLLDVTQWIAKDPEPVYLLGAVPEGPHDQLGYIVPWHDAPQIPTSVYEFVEKPDVRQARKLINAGGLWNTFIFGGTTLSMMDLFRPRFDSQIEALRMALRASADNSLDTQGLDELYDTLAPVDFSRDLLAGQTDKLNVVRMPRCGWWPLKSPKQGQRRLNPAPPPIFDDDRQDRHR